jgi:hypothetical protein
MGMMDEIMKKAKKSGPIDPKHKEAKMGILKQISEMAGGAMGDDIKGLKKVTVASDSPKGLKEGLSKAKDLVEGSDEEEEASESSDEAEAEGDAPSKYKEHSSHENPESKQLKSEIEEAELSDEEIDALIAELKSKKSSF